MALFFADRKDIALVIDVGSSSVGAAVVLLPKNGGVPHVLSSERVQLQFQQHLQFERFMDLMLRALESVVTSVTARAGKHPAQVFCFLASPWYSSQMKTLTAKNVKGFMFNEKTLQKMVGEEAKRFQKEMAEKYPKEKDKVHFIEQKIIDLRLNGYKSVPKTSKVTEVECSILFGVAPEQVTSAIEKRIQKVIPEAGITFHTFVLPFFTVLRDLFHDVVDALLIDIGGEVTDISLMKGETLSGLVSFPLGRNFLLRKAGAVLNKDLEETRSSLKLMFEGKLSPPVVSKLTASLFPVEDEWRRAFRDALEHLGGALTLPHNIFLFADGDVVKWFIDAIRKEEYAQYTRATEKFSVTTVGVSLLNRYLTFGERMERDQFLALESIFLSHHPA